VICKNLSLQIVLI